MRSLPTWTIWSIAVAAVLSPVLAFVMAIAVEILIGVLIDAGLLEFLAVVAAGAIGWSQFRKLRGPGVRSSSRDVSGHTAAWRG